jgi:TetR/AcrR family transcriptional regulator, ethionamide resistance regulator
MESGYQQPVGVVNTLLSIGAGLAIVRAQMPSATRRSSPPRGRRAVRVSGDERESAILATAERLLEDRPPQEISVDELARGAGISRPSFYFYFASKDAVFLTLIDRLVEQADANRGDVLERLGEDPAAGWRAGLQVFHETFGAHRAVVLAGAQIRTGNAEARQLWAEVMESWVTDAAGAIDAERARGAAPPGLPSRDLAVALVSMNERVLYATFAGDPPALAEDVVIEVLLSIWLNAIYGTLEPPSR